MTQKIILVAVLLILIVIIFILNPGEVDYKIYFWKISISKMILLPLTLLAGFFIGFYVAKIRKPRS